MNLFAEQTESQQLKQAMKTEANEFIRNKNKVSHYAKNLQLCTYKP